MTEINFVQKLLERIGKSQSEFARDWGYSRQQVNRWRQGRIKPSLVTVAKWIAAYKLDQEFLQKYLICDGDVTKTTGEGQGGESDSVEDSSYKQGDNAKQEGPSVGPSKVSEKSKLVDLL